MRTATGPAATPAPSASRAATPRRSCPAITPSPPRTPACTPSLRHALKTARHAVADRQGYRHCRPQRQPGKHLGQSGGGEPAGRQRPGQRQGQCRLQPDRRGCRCLRQRRHRLPGHALLQQLGLDGQAAEELPIHGGRPGLAHLQRPGAEKEGQADHHGDRHADRLPRGQRDRQCRLGELLTSAHAIGVKNSSK